MRWILIASTLGSCLWGQRYRKPMFSYDIEKLSCIQSLDDMMEAGLPWTPTSTYQEKQIHRSDLWSFSSMGGFLWGSRRDLWITHLADYFARLGYVVASIDYRLGGEHGSAMHWLRANIHAVQDLRTFVRYMKYLVARENNPFSIDTTKIFVGGWSAGAFTSLCAAYLHTLDELAEIPQADTSYFANERGSLRGVDYLEHTDHFALVFAMAGALYRLSWLSARKVPAMATIHAVDDHVVRYGYESWNHYGIGWAGSQPLDSAARARGIRAWHLAFPMGGHAPWGDLNEIGWAMPQVREFLTEVFYEEQRRLRRPVEPTADPVSSKEEPDLPLAQRNSNLNHGEGSVPGSSPTETLWIAYDGLGRAFGEVRHPDELPAGVWTLWNPATFERRKIYRMP